MTSIASLRFPHVRGDVPTLACTAATFSLISPRAWGCTEKSRLAPRRLADFPTCVGMYRALLLPARETTRFPHVRGDVPVDAETAGVNAAISPRAWGCTDGETGRSGH